jgi:hypothetical protein
VATIRARKQADGTTRFVTWAKHREVALEDPSAFIRLQQGAPTLAALIRWYIENFESVSKWQRSKQAHLEFLERHALGKFNALRMLASPNSANNPK